jgi:LEA14-like dessication related protein
LENDFLKGVSHVKVDKIVLILCSILLLSVSVFAAEQGVVKIQGKIDEIDLKKNRIVVNEKVFLWDANTLFYNENAFPIKVDKFKTDTWVYIEGVRNTGTRQITIKKIYHLPKYIDRGEGDLYPFIH